MPQIFFGGKLQTAGAITLKVLSFVKLQFEAQAYRFSRSYFIAKWKSCIFSKNGDFLKPHPRLKWLIHNWGLGRVHIFFIFRWKSVLLGVSFSHSTPLQSLACSLLLTFPLLLQFVFWLCSEKYIIESK